jgi:hypothetical protein
MGLEQFLDVTIEFQILAAGLAQIGFMLGRIGNIQGVVEDLLLTALTLVAHVMDERWS